jgi:hypothetical protein
MKYAWIEETEVVDGEEILVDGDEILDGEVPFEPPQYEQVSQEPPVYEQVDSGLGYGVVTGLNRAGQDGESTGNITPQQLVWGMDSEAYTIVAPYVFTPITQGELDIIIAAREAVQDERIARLEAIAAAQTSEGGSQYTVAQLDAWLDNQYDVADYDALGLAILQLDDADMSPAARAALVAMFQEIKAVFGKSKAVDRKIGIEILK